MKAIRLWLLMLSTLLVLATGLPAYGQSLLGNNSDFLPVDQAFEYSLKDNNDGTVTLLWDIAPGYYLYRGRMTVEGNNTGLDDVAFLRVTQLPMNSSAILKSTSTRLNYSLQPETPPP